MGHTFKIVKYLFNDCETCLKVYTQCTIVLFGNEIYPVYNVAKTKDVTGEMRCESTNYKQEMARKELFGPTSFPRRAQTFIR